MQDPPLLSLPAEIRAIILAYALPEKIVFDDPGIDLCHNASHRHLFEPACMFSPCLGLTPSCISQFGLLFINKKLFREVLSLLRFHTHISINYTSALTILLPRLDSIFETSPDTIISFRLILRNQDSTQPCILEAAFASCNSYPHSRRDLMRGLLGTAFHVGSETDIERAANDEQLYAKFGAIELSSNWQHGLNSDQRVTLDGFLSFTISRQSTSPSTGCTQALETGSHQTKAASGSGDVVGKARARAPYDTPWYDTRREEQPR